MTYIYHWIEWCLLWYWPSLIACTCVVLFHKWFISTEFYGPSSISIVGASLFGGLYDVALVVFIGFCLWIVVCAIRNGYGIG